ncbi:peptidylprolyl isomerase [Oenococcus oeni]|uniref:peptidylprolyl isomerase n=1 Tax=Oenococcus oeni TaxID=1247 RepID=UPI0008F837D9|nr:peptidylprolyl isomerase [Oenococcus oeni]OIK61628.1 peptidylprolyl isomerase [Oenococcus oeni]OIM65666.1 peptidylprolyl isomerase [Oenococcus oeni]
MTKRNKILIGIGSLLVVVFFVFEIIIMVKQEQASEAASSSSSQASTSSSSSTLNAKYTTSELNKLDLPQLSTTIESEETKVTIETTDGTIVAKIFNKYAPLAAENFLTHAKEGYYNNLDFFRVVKDFMIQSGDPDNTGLGGKSIWASGTHKNKKIDSGSGFKNEISPNLYFIRGAIGMANAGSNTNGSQFFIEQSSTNVQSQITDKSSYPTKIYDAYKKGGTPSLDGNYTVFGQVISGMDVVDKIASAAVKTNSVTSEKSEPKKAIKITKIIVGKEGAQ